MLESLWRPFKQLPSLYVSGLLEILWASLLLVVGVSAWGRWWWSMFHARIMYSVWYSIVDAHDSIRCVLGTLDLAHPISINSDSVPLTDWIRWIVEHGRGGVKMLVRGGCGTRTNEGHAKRMNPRSPFERTTCYRTRSSRRPCPVEMSGGGAGACRNLDRDPTWCRGLAGVKFLAQSVVSLLLKWAWHEAPGRLEPSASSSLLLGRVPRREFTTRIDNGGLVIGRPGWSIPARRLFVGRSSIYHF